MRSSGVFARVLRNVLDVTKMVQALGSSVGSNYAETHSS